MTKRRLPAGLFCISAALLGYELLLMRLLSLAYWGHFAGFIISIALLGLAASGLFLHFARPRVIAKPDTYFSTCAGLFGVAAPLTFVLSQWIPFTPFLLTWSPREYVYLALRVLAFFAPFFFAGIAIGTPFVARALPVPRLYCWNMLGSAAPSLPLLLGMSGLHPMRLLIPVAALGFLAAGLLAAGRRRWAGWITLGLVVCFATGLVPFRYSQYKPLSKTLLLPETRIVSERYDPDGVVHTVHSPVSRYLPGLSLNFAGTLPRSELVFVDGAVMEVVFDVAQARASPDFLRMSPEAFSYQLAPAPRVAILSESAVEILRAGVHGAAGVVAVDPVQERARAIEAMWQRFGLSPMQGGAAMFEHEDPRHFLAATDKTFDVILASQLGSHGAATAGAASLSPSHLFTREGLSLMLDRLSPQGHAVLTTWVENPPRAGVRLAVLIVEALRGRGVSQPERHILAIRSWSTLAFFVAREPHPAAAVAALKEFAEDNSFDLVHYDGITPEEANRFHMIPDEPYFAALQWLVGPDAELYRRQSPFHLEPPTDDQPFFSHFFRWGALPQFVSRMGADWIPFIEWGYLLQVASLAVATLLGFLLLIVPCSATRARPRAATVLLFFALGAAYILAEMWAIYRLDYLLSSPTLAAAVVLATMLAASGAGAVSIRLVELSARARLMVLLGLAGVLALAVVLFPLLASAVYPRTIAVRVVASVLWIAVPAFLMGLPFPTALQQLKRNEEIPWALAMNGFGSVIGSLGASLLAVHLGLTALGLVAVALYGAVVAFLLRKNP